MPSEDPILHADHLNRGAGSSQVSEAAPADQSADTGTAVALASTAPITSSLSHTINADKPLAVRATATELQSMLLPALQKLSKTAVRKTLQDEQVRQSHRIHTACVDLQS